MQELAGTNEEIIKILLERLCQPCGNFFPYSTCSLWVLWLVCCVYEFDNCVYEFDNSGKNDFKPTFSIITPKNPSSDYLAAVSEVL